MFFIKRFQGDEPNKRCHERVCLVTNTQRAGEGCRSQVPLFCLCGAAAMATAGPAPVPQGRLRTNGPVFRTHAVCNAGQ